MSFSKKIYIDQPYLSDYETEVKECVKNDDGNYAIVLNETIFYPHMVGGQLRDCGTINDIEVINTYEKDDTKEVVHITKEPVFGKAKLIIDKERRFDLMQQHTGQHILSAAFWNLFEGKTVGFHMSDTYTTIDIALKQASDDMIRKVELLANKTVYENLPVECNVYTREEAINTGLRKPPVNSDTIRTVRISDIDNIACCGTHLNSTGEVGLIKIIKYENYKGGIRVEFLCGIRALTYFQEINTSINTLAKDFSCKPKEIEVYIDKLRNHNSDLAKSIAELGEKLSEYEVNDFLNKAKTNQGIIIEVFEGRDSKLLRQVLTNLISEDGILVFFVNKDEKGLNIMMGKSKNYEFELKAYFSKIMNIVDGRGGGSDLICQGSSKKIAKLNDLMSELEKNKCSI